MSQIIDKLKPSISMEPVQQAPRMMISPSVAPLFTDEEKMPQYKLQDAVLKEDLNQATIKQSQLEKFNMYKAQAFDKITQLSAMSPVHSIDNLILMLMAAAEFSIQQTKVGNYRLQLTTNAIFEYYNQQQIPFNEVDKIIVAKLVSQMFDANRKKLLRIFSDMFDLGTAAFKLCK